MDPQSTEVFDYVVNAAVTFVTLYFEAILAAFIFLLGYSLLRIGLERLPAAASRQPIHYVRSIAPGGAFALVGAIIFMAQDPLLLAMFLLILTLAAGFGFLAIGYRLIVHGVYHAADQEAVWNDGKLLLGRAGPGAVLALVGVIMIANVLWSAPDDFREYGAERREARAELGEVVDARLAEALDLVHQRFDRASADTESLSATPAP
jgi:hypothetical protein